MCDVPFHDNSLSLDISKDQFEDFFDSNDDSTSIEDNSFSIDDIKYVKASPSDSEPVSFEVMEIVIQEVGGIDADIHLTIKDDILREKLLNINILIANIEALKDNPTSYSDFMTKSFSTSLIFLLEETNTFDNFLPKFETFCFDLKENSSGSTTTHDGLFVKIFRFSLLEKFLGLNLEYKCIRIQASKLEICDLVVSKGIVTNSSWVEEMQEELLQFKLQQFKLDKKKHKIGVEDFREVLQIYPRLPNQEFVKPPSHDEMVTFIKSLGYKVALESIIDLFTDHMYQPWRTFNVIINRYLSGKITGLDKIRLSRAQIPWGLLYKKNVEFVELIWEDFMYQIDNIETNAKRRKRMPYPRFTKAIIQHFISKDKSISMRNKLFMHLIKYDSVLGTLRFVVKGEDNQVYRMLILDRRQTGVTIRDTPSVIKKKTPEWSLKLKGMEMLSDAAMLETNTRKEMKTSLRDLRSQHHTGGSSEGAGI
uniref:Uncharacterized protein n=1 Tax=Tanacetum cinerariifolium TaxID=118510 RepID=A0A6L2JBP8_TANCI|nr:hypothetical protein [Tanacetum cinerariifolium]